MHMTSQHPAAALSRAQASITAAPDGKKALTTTVVVMVELVKVTVCTCEIMYRRVSHGRARVRGLGSARVCTRESASAHENVREHRL